MSATAGHMPTLRPKRISQSQVVWLLLATAVLTILLKPFLPGFLDRHIQIFPWEQWLDAWFDWLQNDLGLIHVTRWLAQQLGFLIDTVANILYGKSRWPRIEALPWTAIGGVLTVLGWVLGGWRLALLSLFTCGWAAMMGQWKWSMEMMSVVVVSAPISFLLGLLMGIWAWKSPRVEKSLKPILLVLQTLPFFSYLLPAVIFFKVGPTAAATATIVYSIPPIILMTAVGLKKVPPEVVEAGKMAGCTKWQMLTRVYLPSARNEVLIGLNQVIMLSLSMVVLTALIGMPGLGAKLLANMGSFKLGRSFEIGVTIVLIAVLLDRLTKAWIVRQPEHFEKGTPWWRRNFGLLAVLGVFAFFMVVAGEDSILREVGRKQSWSQAKPLDTWIKDTLALPWLTAITGTIRYVLNVWVLIPTEHALLYIPTWGVIAFVTAFCLAIGGVRPALVGALFFFAVSELGWWDRAMLTLHSTLIAVFLAMILGMPVAIWASRSEKAARRMIMVCDTAQTFPSFVYLLPAIMLFGISPTTVIMSILIYTMVPVVRYTIEGIRSVPAEMTEAAEMSGATRWQKLTKVQLPLAMPTIAVGLNQALVFAFFMVIIAAYIGTRDLGQELQRTLAGTHLGKNFTLGFSAVFMALTFDVAINAWAERRRKMLGL